MTRFTDDFDTNLDQLDLSGPLVDGGEPGLMTAWPRPSQENLLDDHSTQPGVSPAESLIARSSRVISYRSILGNRPAPTELDSSPPSIRALSTATKPPSQKTTPNTPKSPDSDDTDVPSTKPPAKTPKTGGSKNPEPPHDGGDKEPPPSNPPSKPPKKGGEKDPYPPKKKPPTKPPKPSDSGDDHDPPNKPPTSKPPRPPQPPQVPETPPQASPTDLPPAVGNDDADIADSHTPYTPYAGYPSAAPIDLTDTRSPGMGDNDDSPRFFARIGRAFRDLLSGLFSGDDKPVIPVSLPPNHTPPPQPPTDPTAGFKAGYISQRDLENALGWDSWTLCCATTVVYAIQTKYPDIDRDTILSAAKSAAATPLAPGDGDCVKKDGTVDSYYQFSQALSRKLELTDYVDVSGQYGTVAQAQAAGAAMMKVELSGLIDDRPQEHHVFRVGGAEIDPVPGIGINGMWEEGSRKVQNVMALDWYTVPCSKP